MKYAHFEQLPGLIEQKLVTARPHPTLPLLIYNYSVTAQFQPIEGWTEALQDCRGLILDQTGEIVGRPFRKFWNYEQVLDRIPANEKFNVWEKLDGSLGIVTCYAGERVAATRGSFDSDQARWLGSYLNRKHPNFYPDGTTYLLEIVYPANRIVVDYGATEEAFLLAVLDDAGRDLWPVFEGNERFRKARRWDGLSDFAGIDGDDRFAGQEGFVVQWESGFRAKIKLAEYKRLHRLITQCSTRTIWEMLRSGSVSNDLTERVPADFQAWAQGQITALSEAHAAVVGSARRAIERDAPRGVSRKEFALWATQYEHPGLLFSLLDGKDITGAAWKLVEPKWATPFRKEAE